MSAPAPALDRGTNPSARTPSTLHESPWRPPLAAAALIAAAAHVPVTGEHLEEALYIGVLFLLLEIACVASAIVLLLAPSRLMVASTALVGALAVVAFVVSRTAGLPLIGDDVGQWTEPLAAVSVAAESVMVACGLLALRDASTVTPRMLRAGTIAGALILAAGALAVGLSVAASGSSAAEGTGTGGHGSGHEKPGHDMSGHGMVGMHMSGTDASAP